MMREFKRYAFLFFAVMLFSVAKAGDKEWTLNANGTEWLYTYQTKTKQVYIKEWDDYYSVYGVIQLSFRNDKDESRIANDRWTDYAMRVGNIDGFNSSGYVSVYVYYNNQWNLRNDIACGFYYYNSDPDNDGNWQFTKNKIEPNYWFDMDVQSGIKLYFEDGNGNKLETVSPTRPRDLETPRWSTTEGTIRHYRTNLYNDFDKDFLSLNKSVRFAKKSGDGTYLFNPVWGQFSKGGYIDQDDPGTGSVTAKNVYVPNALDWTGEITSESVVESPIDEYGKYTLSIAAPFPMTAYKYRTDPNRHFMTQAIVRASEGQVIQMGFMYADPQTKEYKYVYPENAKVKGVGMSDDPNNQVFGTVYPTGRVDNLLRVANGGWVKLEAPMRINEPSDIGADEWTLECWGRMILTSDQPFQVSDIFLMWRPNQDTFYQTSANGAVNDIKDKDINVSWVDLTAQKKFSLFDRGDNLNRVVKVSDTSIFAQGGGKHQHPCNVIVAGHTPLLYLTDRGVLVNDADGMKANTGVWADKDKNGYMKSGYTFGVEEEFTADKVWFDRDFARTQDANGNYHSMSTVYLPFAMDAADLQKFHADKAHKFVSVDGSKATFEEVTSTEPNTPYLIEPSDAVTGSHEAPLEFTNKTIAATNAAEGDFIGTYSYQTLPATADGYTNYIFGFNTQKFNNVAAAGASFKPFRAYLRSADTNAAKSLVLNFSTGTTDGIDSAVAAESSDAPVYSIDGTLVKRAGNLNGLQKGVYIQNGKKVIIK